VTDKVKKKLEEILSKPDGVMDLTLNIDQFYEFEKQVLKCTNLSKLQIFKPFDEYECPTLPIEIFEFKELEVLWLENFGDRVFPKEIAKLTQLKELYIRHFEMMSQISPEIGELTKLEVLEISHNYILKNLPIQVYFLPKLEELEMHHSGITHIPKEVENLSSLKYLGLYGCVISELPLDELVKLKENELDEINLMDTLIEDSQYVDFEIIKKEFPTAFGSITYQSDDDKSFNIIQKLQAFIFLSK